MNGEKVKERKWSFKRVAATVLCSCMVLTSADMTALAAGAQVATDKIANFAAENLQSDKKGAYLTPDQEKSMVEEAPFGAYNLSESNFYRKLGESVKLKVYAWSNQGTVSYTWYHPMGYELESITDTLVVENLQFGDESDFGTYTCLVSDGVNKKELKFNVNMDMGTLYVEGLDNVNSPTMPLNLFNGQKLYFSLDAKDYNGKEVTYQWYRGTERLEGETKSTCTAVHEGTSGEYTQYYCIVSNGESAYKKNFQVYTLFGQYSENLSTWQFSSSQGIYKIGTELTFKADTKQVKNNSYLASTKPGDLTYQWYVDGEKIEGATGTEYTFQVKEKTAETAGTGYYEVVSGMVMSGYKYCCEVSNGSYSGRWSFVVIPVSYDVSSFFWGGTFTYYDGRKQPLEPRLIIANSSGLKEEDLSYQWYRKKGINGVEEKIEGASDKRFILEKLKEEDFGYFYYCRVSWNGGYTDSTTMYVSKSILYHVVMSHGVAYPGEEVTFSVSGVDENLEATYQWYVDGEKIEGATGAFYTKIMEESDFSKKYHCILWLDGVEYEATGSKVQMINTDSAEWFIGNQSGTEDSGTSDIYALSSNVYYNRVKDEQIVLDPEVTAGSQAKLTYKWEIGEYEFVNNVKTLVWETLEETGDKCTIDTESLDSGSIEYQVTVSDGTHTRVKRFTVSQENTIIFEETKYASALEDSISGENENVLIGKSVSLSAPKASSTVGEITYQWQKWEISPYGTNSYVDIEGATEAVYTISKVESLDCTLYQCVISDGNKTKYYTVRLDGYPFNVQVESNVDGSNSNYAVYPGQKDLYFKLNINPDIKDAEYTYKWEKIVPIRELVCEGDTLSIDEMSTEMSGYYQVTVSAGDVQATAGFYLDCSKSMKINGYGYGAFNTKYAEVGDRIPLVVETIAPEGENISYQWCKENVEIAGAINSAYVVSIDNEEDYGSYLCKMTINGEQITQLVGIQKREQDNLRAFAAKSTSSSKEVTVSIGETTQLETVAYCKDYPLEYQWYKLVGENQFEAIEGAKSSAYPLTVKSAGDYATYKCDIICKEKNLKKSVYVSVLDTNTVEKLPWGSKDSDNKNERPSYDDDDDEMESNPVPGNPNGPENSETTQNPGTSKLPENPSPIPTSVAVAGVAIDKATLDLNVGQEATLVSVVLPENAANKSVTWTSSNDAVASVMADGRVIAKAAGQAVITVVTADGAKTAQCTVTVKIPASKVMLTQALNLVKGDERKLSAIMLPSNASDTITWTSSKDSVVKVDADGKVVAVAPGTANIKATTSTGKTAICKITVVKKKIKATKVTLSLGKKEVECDELVQLKATLKPSKSTDDLTWSSSNKQIATVDKNGIVTLKKPGKVTITVKTESGKKDTLEIDVKQPAKSVTLAKKSVIVKVDKTVNLKAKLNPSDSTDKLKWSTSNKKIATVNDKGQVKGVRAGIVKITVKTSSGKKAECKVTVKKE